MSSKIKKSGTCIPSCESRLLRRLGTAENNFFYSPLNGKKRIPNAKRTVAESNFFPRLFDTPLHGKETNSECKMNDKRWWGCSADWWCAICVRFHVTRESSSIRLINSLGMKINKSIKRWRRVMLKAFVRNFFLVGRRNKIRTRIPKLEIWLNF